MRWSTARGTSKGIERCVFGAEDFDRSQPIWRAVWRLKRRDLVISGIFKLLGDLLEFAGPLILNYFVEWSLNKDRIGYQPEIAWIGKGAFGYVLALGMFLSMLLSNYFQELHYMVRIIYYSY